MKTIRLALVALLFFMGLGEASLAQKVGTSSFQFLKVMPTARGTAMGDAYTTLASGADAVFWNPSGLTLIGTQNLSTTLTLWLFDTKQGALAYALPLGDFGTFGLQLQYVDYGTIEETRVDHLMFVGTGSNVRYNPGLTGQTFSPKTYLVGLSYARQFTERFSAGFTAKYVSETLWSHSNVTVIGANGVAEDVNTYARRFLFDFGMRYSTGYRAIDIAIAVQNFGGQVLFAKEEYPAPMAFRVGVASNVIGKNALLIEDESNRVTLAYDIFQPNDYAQQMHLGLEYSFSERFALRTGYKFNYDSDGLTLGGGVNSNLAGLNLALDYSYGAMGTYLPKVHRISLGARFQ